jgi:hypothetical protein
MKLTGDVENMCLDARRKLANVANVCAGVGMEAEAEGEGAAIAKQFRRDKMHYFNPKV